MLQLIKQMLLLAFTFDDVNFDQLCHINTTD